MIGLVLVTHGNLGAEFLTVINRIVGPQEQVATISVGYEDDLDKSSDEILAAIKQVNSGEGVILLTDMFGGTPSNLAISMMPNTNALVLAGVNLPVLVKLASVRGTMKLMDAAREAEMSGKKYIQLVSETLASPAS